MKRWNRLLVIVLLTPLAMAGCRRASVPTRGDLDSLLDVRANHKTSLKERVSDPEPLGEPDSDLFRLIRYPSENGALAAWISNPPEDDAAKMPVMIWITGGFPPGGIDNTAWEPASVGNDQSAKAYREAGMLMMYPTFRGCNGNPGSQEGFYGEVDDVIAAANYLLRLDHVDRDRIYLGGHSTGATLALLVAESTKMFAGVVCFGPVGDPGNYGEDTLLFDTNRRSAIQELELRAPIHYLDFIKTPTIIAEGSNGNLSALRSLERFGKANNNLLFVEARGMDHFNILAPANKIIAERLMSHGELKLETSDFIREQR